MKRLKFNLSEKYEVVLDENLLDRLGEELALVAKPCKVMVVSDDCVKELFGDRVEAALSVGGYETHFYTFPQGEGAKTLATVASLAATLSDHLFTKADLIVGLGSGVATDIAAMTASLYYRGMRHVFVPTTLTAAIDAAIGGKIGINENGVKNLLGGFYQPIGVYVDTQILSELKRSVFMHGMAVAIKYAFVGNKKLFDYLKTGKIDLEEVVYRCIQLKYRYIKRDEDERGKRILLDYGHTFGNAIERLSEYTLSHGESVGIGMVVSAKISENLFLQDGMSAALEETLAQYGLPSKCEYTAEQIYEAAITDKKRSGEYMGLVLTKKIGKASLMRVETEKFRELIKLGIS